MSVSAVMILIAAAFLFAGLIQTFGRHRPSLRWFGTGLVAAIGGYIASEFLGPASAWGWEWDGLAVFPAIIAVILVGVLAEAAMRKFVTT